MGEADVRSRPSVHAVVARKLKLDTLLAGGIAGAAARTLTSPLDRVKILMQTQYLSSGGAADQYKGIWQSLVKVYKEDGFRGYWRGNGANCVRVVPYSATQFVTFDHCKTWILSHTGRDSNEKLHIPERLVCGAIAGMMASAATHPLDVVRTRMAVQPELMGIFHTLATLWTEGGVSALYKGLGPTLASLAPFVAINFASYDTIKNFFYPNDNIRPSTLGSLCMGGSAGIIAQTACYPLDTVRRRMQMKGKNYTSTINAIVTISRVEGATALYKGIWANTLKVAPNNAIRFMVFEQLKGSKVFAALFGY
uniref:Mitochondrial carrier protein n=1 Tax=Hemiselmis andersenii TaxID=464988 RepID=A0A6T8GPB6_HEMAN|mmetsp:Transcript_4864/g.11294  ORF Transcript_4864/g.11294 Transcript_4864/m.11294 type:complete len:309 (+) Transcript_4864:34-960(+)|eukprot:CAMPEP_0114144386 /NCGR_PEP_ID=MMETSP0043_2-20121206/19492_1 /TAXON_ID=464988 /ORGANISM="Hemiselmis andersenii, Strain CCMP644" /LENGTH=308 /DNA_ID=CAMNT_0001238747 /DNA_START=31 /DNA_END=957 /DNA_ORIENTATION=-